MTMEQRNRWVPVLAGLALLGANPGWTDVAPAAAPAAVAAPAGTAPATAVAEAPAATAEKPAAAEPAVTGPKLSGYIQGSFDYNLDDPMSGMTAMRVYDVHHNSFELNNAHVALTGSVGDASYALETDMGHDAAIHKSAGFGQTTTLDLYDGAGLPVVDGSGNPPTVSVDTDVDTFDVQEAYVTFPDPFLAKLGVKATVKVGKFVTYEGIELIESKDNPTISRGYLFGFAEPYTHVGGAMTMTFGAVAVTAGILNGWDRLIDDNRGKMGVANINIGLGEKVGMVNLTAYSGSEVLNTGLKKNSLDLTGVLKLLPMTDLWYQVNYGDEQQATGGVSKWGGAALEPLIHLSDTCSLGLRGEYFDSKPYGVAYGAGAATFVNGTICFGWNFAKNVTARFEFRHDESASSYPFDDSIGNFHHRTNTLSHELVMTF